MLTVCNHANRNNFNLEENKETLEELRMSSFTELKSFKSLESYQKLANICPTIPDKEKQDLDLVLYEL